MAWATKGVDLAVSAAGDEMVDVLDDALQAGHGDEIKRSSIATPPFSRQRGWPSSQRTRSNIASRDHECTRRSAQGS